MLRTYAIWERKRAILITLIILGSVSPGGILALACTETMSQGTFIPGIIVTQLEVESFACALHELYPCFNAIVYPFRCRRP